VAAGHRAPLYTKADFYAEIGKRAEALRREGETKEQSFTRFITQESEGKTLYTALKRSQGTIEAASPRQVTQTEPAPTPSLVALNKLAEEARKADPKLSFAQAFTKVYQDPKNRALAAAEKAERRARAMKDAGVPAAPTGVGKGSIYPSGQLASARLSDKASTLATVTGLDHPSCLARVRAANPLLAAAADAESAAA
jgi:hypothetical protein